MIRARSTPFAASWVQPLPTVRSSAEQPKRIGGEPGLAGAPLGSLAAFATERPLQRGKAWTAAGIFVAVVTAASLNLAPIAACAFAGAVLLIVLRVITADEAITALGPRY